VRRLVVVVTGLALGASLGVLLGGCGGYFECETHHHHIVAGTYSHPGTDFELVIDAERHAVVTYTDGGGSLVSANYTLGPERQTPQAQ
jgi:hypothetical protein